MNPPLWEKVAAASGGLGFNTSLATIRSNFARAFAEGTAGFILRSVNSCFTVEVSFTVLPQPLKFGGRTHNSGGNCSSGPSLLLVKTKKSFCQRFYGHRYFTVRIQCFTIRRCFALAPPPIFKTFASVARVEFSVWASASVLSCSSSRSITAKSKQNE